MKAWKGREMELWWMGETVILAETFGWLPGAEKGEREQRGGKKTELYGMGSNHTTLYV